MDIKKHTLFKWNSLFFGDWIWLIMVLAPLAGFVRAVQYNYMETCEGIPAAGWVAFPTVITVFWAITFLRFWYRAKFIKSIKFYTKQGMAIVLEGKAQERFAAYPDGAVKTAFEDAIDFGINFFVNWAKGSTMHGSVVGEPATYESLVEGLNGGVLAVVGDPLLALSTHGPLPPSLQHKLMGVTFLNRITITRDGDRVRTLMDLSKLLKHEIGHYCLEQLGHLDVSGGGEHHALFEKIKYPN